MNTRKIRKSDGISLLEVLVSMLILGLGILGLAPMVVLSIEGNNISHDFTLASKLASDKLEFFEGLDSLPAIPYSETETGLQGSYSRVTTMVDSTSDSSVPGDMARVDVQISWTDKTGQPRRTSYSTLLAKDL
jgi:type IV pilus assembly protein PilV